jgi:hypothetical protein
LRFCRVGHHKAPASQRRSNNIGLATTTFGHHPIQPTPGRPTPDSVTATFGQRRVAPRDGCRAWVGLRPPVSSLPDRGDNFGRVRRVIHSLATRLSPPVWLRELESRVAFPRVAVTPVGLRPPVSSLPDGGDSFRFVRWGYPQFCGFPTGLSPGGALPAGCPQVAAVGGGFVGGLP